MKDNDRAIVTFAGIAHALVHTYELSIPILVVIWLAEFPVTTAEVGLVVAVGYGLFGIGALPGGLLADRYGSHALITACLVGMGGSFLLLSAATGLLTIALALALWGIAASVYHPAGLSLISTGVEDRGSGFAYHGMAGNAGIAGGPLATALLLLVFDWRVVALLLVVPAVVAVGYALRTDFDETAAVRTHGDGGTDVDGGVASNGGTGPTTVAEFLARTRAVFTVAFTVALAIIVLNGLFYRGTLTFLPDVLGSFLPEITGAVGPFKEGSAVAEAFDLSSYLYAGLLTVGIGGQYLGGKLTNRIHPTAGLAALLVVLCLVAVAFVPAAEAGLLPLLVVSAALGLALFAIQPLYQATVAEVTPPDGRGLSYGYTYLAGFGVGALGAAIAGVLLAVVDVNGTFLALAAFPAVGAVLSFALWRAEWE